MNKKLKIIPKYCSPLILLDNSDILNLLGILFEIIGFVFLLTPLKEKFVRKKLTIKEKIESMDVLEKESEYLAKKITLWQLLSFYKTKMKNAGIHKTDIDDFMFKHEKANPTSRDWYNLSNDYHTLMAKKQFSFVEWIAIILVVGGLSFQGLSILMEKGITLTKLVP